MRKGDQHIELEHLSTIGHFLALLFGGFVFVLFTFGAFLALLYPVSGLSLADKYATAALLDIALADIFLFLKAKL